ncbi:DUF2268 domain-containing protein [Gracilibacillus xinjiangensis]|uniref:DUF2268 domain-containing protein n=1 Tax=Gracilibacillus xinjiangensis TaxID=1193282 RepID=A0ABV8WS71_9BACI
MTVQPTSKWLQNYLDSPFSNMTDKMKQHRDILCKPIEAYFDEVNALSIQNHLLHHGLFPPSPSDEHIINKWLQRKYDQLVEKLYKKYRKAWSGPSANIFIFPSNYHSKELNERFSGCTGLSYPKKLFLFINHQAKAKQVAALFLHEYSHTCRLNFFKKSEADYTLLDAIILEGVAEYVVRSILGEEFGNQWIKHYSYDEAKWYIEKWVYPNLTVTRNQPKHDLIMYGNMHGIPQNLGYHIGYYLIQQFTKDKTFSIKEILYIDNGDAFNSNDWLK